MTATFFGVEIDTDLRGNSLLEAYNLENNPFTDTDIEAWYAPYLIFAYSYGVVRGYQDETGNFGPGNEVTYAEFVKMATLMSDYENASTIIQDFEL